MTQQELYKNKYVQLVLDEASKIIKKMHEEDPKLEKKDARDKMSTREKFILDAFSRMTEVLQKVEMVNYYVAFINSYPKSKLWEKTFSRADYIRYHTETYLSNITGVLDRCLLLVNQLYGLGIEEKYVKFDLITSNKNIKNEPVKKALDIFSKSISNIKYLRNFVDHQGRFSEKELDEIATYEFLIQSGAKFTRKQTNIIKVFVIKFGFSKYISKTKKDAIKSNANLIKLCDLFFSSLVDKLNAKLKDLPPSQTRTLK